MKRFFAMILAVLLAVGALPGCAASPGGEAGETVPHPDASAASSTSAASDASAAYAKLIAYRTEGYLQQSVADFNAALAPTPDALTELLAAQADVISTISADDENYDFFTTTMDFSTNELYCQHRGEELTFFAGISKQTRPSQWLDEDGEIWYEFSCFADLCVSYSISSPERVTVAERDNMLLTFKEEMQKYLNGLSETEITDGNFRTKLMDKAAGLAGSLSSENMKLSSCEISQVEISDSGEEIRQ